MSTDKPKHIPPQEQDQQPGLESEMTPKPEFYFPEYKGAGKLDGKVALVTGGDSGIGRSVSVLFAREGADVAIIYLNEHDDAHQTKALVEAEGRRCLLAPGDVGSKSFCTSAVDKTVSTFGKLDILVNNAAVQFVQQDVEEITEEQLEKTFRTNFYGYFFMAQAALKHMQKGAAIINTTSITAYEGHPLLIDYSSTKGAILSFTRALSQSLAEKGIRVNAVAPGPIWTPLIPATFPADKVAKFGKDTPMGRPGQPEEVAPSYVFLASQDASYISGQTIHPNGGQVVNG